MRRTQNSLPLDDDIVDQILTFCPDFETLNSLILVCKALQAVFSTHPNSINTDVARNFIGTAFPEALRHLRYEAIDGKEDNVNTPQAALINPAETAPLRRHAVVVHKLETIFSRWYKDRKSPTSVLSLQEAFRFQRAMYRVMIYCARFSSCKYDENTALELSESSQALQDIYAQRLAMLTEYPTADLHEIHTVVIFLHQLIDWVLQDAVNTDHDDPKQTYDICIAAGPALVLAAYESDGIDPIEEKRPIYESYEELPLFAGFFSRPLAQIWKSRDVPAPPEDSAHLASILETVPGGLDSCKQCSGFPVSRLWTSATWEHFDFDPPELLPGMLALNRHEIGTLNALLGPREAWPTAFSALVAEIFHDVQRQPGYENWEEEDSLCDGCLVKILTAHFYLWLLWKRVKDGWITPEDCWYGYDCKTQMHKANHAKTKNHLCAPTR
ncbi:hypothetical protein C8R44DRAFT_657551 [Mycena epipterygia]|nr:hypothetical protein C8R44DRAFT_657551 [Mycena epipterygia]